MGITITETPKVKYRESKSDPTLSGSGAEIPIIIGISGNESPKTGIQRFDDYTDACKTIANGGIGTDTSTNPLLAFLEGFFAESKKKSSGDLKVPYVYVIDLGNATVKTASAWASAFEVAKVKREVQVEVYVGFKKETNITANDFISLLETANEYIVDDSEHGNPRIGYFTVEGYTNAELKALTTNDTTKIQQSRIVCTEPSKFPKYVARICTTHYSEEPGFYEMRSVKPGEFPELTRLESESLQNAGIIFGQDEKVGSRLIPRINLAVSTAFAANPDYRPNDSWLHARRNTDQLIREAYEIVFEQLKRNETEINLSYLQSDLDVLVDEKINLGYMMDGTALTVKESADDPVDLLIEGVSIPVNSSLIIEFTMYVKEPNVIAGGR